MKLAAISALALFTALTAPAEVFNFYGDAQVVSPGPAGSGEPAVLQLTSDPLGIGYAGVYDTPSTTLTVGSLITLSANYEMTQGTIGNGAPRFSLIDTTSNMHNEAYVYFGTPAGGGSFTDPSPGTWESTGNYADPSSSDIRVYNNGFGGFDTPNTGETWAQFVAQVGANTQIAFVSLDEDGGFSATQQVDVDNFTVNGDVYDAAPTPEPGTLVLFAGSIALMVGFRRKAF